MQGNPGNRTIYEYKEKKYLGTIVNTSEQGSKAALSLSGTDVVLNTDNDFDNILPEGSGTLITKTITENGTYNAQDDDADGYSEVTVDVEGGSILTGNNIPDLSLGKNGDLYLRERVLPNITFKEYLISDGNAYIDTGIYATELIDVYCKTKNTGNHVVFGAKTGSFSSLTNVLYGTFTGSSTFSLVKSKTSISGGASGVAISVAAGTVIECSSKSMVLDNKSVFSIAYNGIYKYSRTDQDDFTSVGTMILFGGNESGTLSIYPSQIYRITFYSMEEVIADYLPCVDDNNIPCMYEAVSGTFKYSSAEGNFTYGDTVIPTLKNTLYLKQSGEWIAIASDVVINK